MKSSLWWLAAFILMVSASAGRATAQQCITFSDDLAAYTDESTDGTYIYTSVAIDGSEEMIINPTCAPYLPQYVHTPWAYNQLSIPGGAIVGGWESGTPVCPDCYLSFTNDQSIAANPGVNVDFEWQVEAICSGGGGFFGTDGFVGIAIAVTTFHIVTVNADGTGTFKQACPGTTRASCGAQNLLGRQPTIWAEEYQLRVTIGGSGPICSPVGIVQYFNGPPAPFPCT